MGEEGGEGGGEGVREGGRKGGREGVREGGREDCNGIKTEFSSLLGHRIKENESKPVLC